MWTCLGINALSQVRCLLSWQFGARAVTSGEQERDHVLACDWRLLFRSHQCNKAFCPQSRHLTWARFHVSAKRPQIRWSGHFSQLVQHVTHQNNVSHHFDADFSPWHEETWLKTRARASRIWDSERNFSAALSKGGGKKKFCNATRFPKSALLFLRGKQNVWQHSKWQEGR